MTMLTDRYGLSLTTDSSVARDAYVQAIDLLLSANAGVPDALQQALVADPGFALAQTARARWLQLNGQILQAQQAASRAAHLAPSASRRGSEPVRHRPSHGCKLPHLSRPNGSAGSTSAHAFRQLAECAVQTWRLCGQFRGYDAALEQRSLQVDPAPCAAADRAASLCHSLLPRPASRHPD